MSLSVAAFFSFDEPESLTRYVAEHDLLQGAASNMSVERAGDGNMNFVARIRSGRDSVILKQSRPWVEKYPSIEAPAARILTEIAFYDAVSCIPSLQERMPRLIHSDPKQLVAGFEDLGDAADFTTIYASERAIDASDLSALLRWLSELHRQRWHETDDRITNREMRTLNHAHIFSIPLASDNDLDLDDITPGLAPVARHLQSDQAFVDAVADLGRIYLLDGHTLLHGDFYPGSWIRGEDGPAVIDPEFAFHGRREFDVGVCRAHLLIGGLSPDEVNASFSDYQPPPEFDQSVADGFAGVEIMRRLIGVAQLPMDRTLAEKEALLS
ncbi:MAG: phosphotransferase, partial [Rhodothermales bacterium]|nr:phosphotransferase [Rhodothermales bacterium]